MAIRGRKPKPTAQRKLTGNPGRRPMPAELDLDASAPACPQHMDPEARREWQRVVKLLDRAGVLTQVDRGILAAYCRAWSLFVEADKHVQDEGSMLVSSPKAKEDPETGEIQVTGGAPYQSPWVHQLTSAAKAMVNYAAELGMTPVARTRVKAQRGDQAASSLLDFLTGKTTDGKAR